MGLAGSKPKPPPTADPAAIPEIEDEDVQKGKPRRKKGKAETILTGDLVPPDIGLRTLLGG